MSAAFPEWPSPHRRCVLCLITVTVEELMQLGSDHLWFHDWTPVHPARCKVEWKKLTPAQQDVRMGIRDTLRDNRRIEREAQARADGTHQYFYDVYKVDHPHQPFTSGAFFR